MRTKTSSTTSSCRNGRVKETVERPNGVQIVTIRNRYGDVLKRSRITPDGREYILAYYDESNDDEDSFSNWRDPGDDLPPLRLTIPIRDYIIDADDSDEEDVELFFRKPPVEQVRRIYYHRRGQALCPYPRHGPPCRDRWPDLRLGCRDHFAQPGRLAQQGRQCHAEDAR